MLTTTLVADLETPVSAYLKLARGRAGNMFLLESVEGGAQRGRYSMIGLDPDLDLPLRTARKRRDQPPRRASTATPSSPCPGQPLEALRALLAESRIDLPPGLPPMSAGVFGYLGYDMVRQMERLRAGQARPDRRARGAADPPDGDGGVRRRARRDGRRRRRSARAPGVTARAAREAARGAARRGRRRARRPARPCRRPPSIRRCSARRGRLEHDRGRVPRRWSTGRRTISAPATRSRSCCRSASPAASTCRRSRSIARCGGSIRRPISASSISAASRSSSPARKSWCGCATAR